MAVQYPTLQSIGPSYCYSFPPYRICAIPQREAGNPTSRASNRHRNRHFSETELDLSGPGKLCGKGIVTLPVAAHSVPR